MMPRHHSTTTLSILTLVILQVIILVDVSPEVILLLLSCIFAVVSEVPLIQSLTGSWDVNQTVRTVVVNHVVCQLVGVTCAAVTVSITHIHTLIDQTNLRTEVLAVVLLVRSRDEQTVRGHVGTITQLHIVVTVYRVTVVIVCRRNLIAYTITIRLSLRIGVRSREVQTECKLLGQRCSDRVVVCLMTSVCDHVRVVFITLREVVTLITRSQLHCLSIPIAAEVDDSSRIELTAIDTLQREINIVRQLGIQCQRSLPCSVHLQVLVDDGRRRRSCCILTVNSQALLLQYLHLLITASIELIHQITSTLFRCSIIIIGVLTATSVAYCRYEPNERQTTYEITCTTTENQLVIAEDIPVETYTRRNCQWSIRKLIGRVAMLITSIILILQSSESLVVAVLQLWIDRQLETQTCGETETVREVNLILNISRELVVLHGSLELTRTIHREGNAIASRSLAVDEVVHRLEHIVTGRSSTEAVGSLVGLELETSGEVLDTHRP